MDNLGMKRIERELEIDKFLRWQFKIKIALKALFSKPEWFLIENNHQFVLNYDDDVEKYLSEKKVRSETHFLSNEIGGERFKRLLDQTGILRRDDKEP